MMLDKPSFVHLHVHTEFSIFDSVVKIDKLIEACKKEGMFAVAITDLCNLFGAVKFFKKAVAAGIKPIFGAEVWGLRNESRFKLVLLCQNDKGFLHLRQLLSRAYTQADRDGIPIIPLSWIQSCSQGLIAILTEDKTLLDIVQSGDDVQARQILETLKAPFEDRFYLSLTTRKGGKQDIPMKQTWQPVIKCAQLTNTPVVATNPVCFIDKQDFEAHEARVCIQEGTTLNQTRVHRYDEAQYFKSIKEMHTLFKDIPSSLDNTVEIAKRCNVKFNLGQVCLPNFPVPNGESVETQLRKKAHEGLDKRFETRVYPKCKTEERASKKQHYESRLKRELDVIIDMGFASYFLIVADFIQWAIDNDIPVGPGRGSGAGSLVAYALNITDLDPIDYDLLFERFLNPERVSMPDFDIDFCMERRDEVIDYVAKRYGRKSVSQIATFGTMAAKAVIRDVGRVLGHSYGYVDRIAKMIPFELGMTLEKALSQEDSLKKLYKSDEEVKSLIDLGKKLEGLVRNVGKHAGGVVIAPTELSDFSPLYCEEGSTHVVTQYDKDDVEAVGLVKFDFLGLRTLTIIHWAVQFVNELRAMHNEPPMNVANIPLDDPKTYDLLKACHTTAVFQLESRGMKDLIQRLQPDQFEEIVALVALFRPGPLQSGMVDDFINRKHGRALVEYPHPDLEPILKPTYGVILYQEQVMQIAQALAGYTLGGADLLRRAMGKKKVEEMAEQRAIFVKGATARGVEEKTATYIFDLMEKFAGYGFNKSHSAAYALVSYQTAWLKAHYPNAFMAAVLSSDMAHTDKVVTFVEEVKERGLTLIKPDVNQSFYKFTLNQEGAIVYGLGAIKGVGESAIESMVEARQNGSFLDLFDFCKRVDLRKVNRRVLEALIKSGSMDCFEVSRTVLMASLDSAIMQAEQALRDVQSGQVDMFSEHKASIFQWVESEDQPLDVMLRGEKESLGFYWSGHPMDTLKEELSQFTTHTLANLPERSEKVVVAGIVHQVRTLMTKKGDRMAFISLEDGHSRFETAIFSDLYKTRREFISKDTIIVVSGQMSVDSQTKQVRLRAEEVLDLARARAKFAKRLKLTLKGQFDKFENVVEGLKSVFQEERGECPVVIDYCAQEISARLHLGQAWKILPSNEFLNKLKEALGEHALKLEYS